MRVAFQLEATKKEIIKKSETAEYLEQQVRLKAFHQGPPNFKLMYVFFLINQVTLWICKDTAMVIYTLNLFCCRLCFWIYSPKSTTVLNWT